MRYNSYSKVDVMSKTDIDMDEIVNRILLAVVKMLEGGDDPQRKYDNLTKMNHDTVKTMANLSETQIDSAAESSFLGNTFLSLTPLKIFAVGHAQWSPSKQGKRAEQVTATMISQETHLVPTLLEQQKKDKKNRKEKEND